jgi:hypothetical protein
VRLLLNDRPADAARLARDVLRARRTAELSGFDDDGALVSLAAHAIERADGAGASADFLREIAGAKPTQTLATLIHWMLVRGGNNDAARAFAEARSEAAPDDLEAALLTARSLPREEAQPRIALWRQRAPADPGPRRMLALLAMHAGKPDECLAELAPIEDVAERDAALDVELSCAVAAGKAQALADALVERGKSAQTFEHVMALATLTRVAAVTLPYTLDDAARRAAPGDGLLAFVKLEAGEAVTPNVPGLSRAEDGALRMSLAVREGADELAKIADRASSHALELAPDDVLVLAAAELQRAGKVERAFDLWSRVREPASPLALIGFVEEGRPIESFWRFSSRVRAALVLARARVLESRGEDAATLRAEVERRDTSKGAARIALQKWPPAARNKR